MKYEITKKTTIEKTYEVEANSEEEALEYIDNNPYCFDDEEHDEEIIINGENFYG